jgi:hypothetical protein
MVWPTNGAVPRRMVGAAASAAFRERSDHQPIR